MADKPKTIGRNQNTTGIATLPAGITLNSSTSTLLIAANPDRVFFYVGGRPSEGRCWIKLQATDVDDDKKGILFSGSEEVGSVSQWQMPNDNIYTGEICAIANSGSPELFVVEY